MQQQIINIMKWLRDRAKTIRTNNIKINEWVDSYIEQCILNGKPVEILTQYCLSKDLETRYKAQGDKFLPLSAEFKMFTKTIPDIIQMFKSNGVLKINWYITFNNSFLDRGRVSDDIVDKYSAMIENIAENKDLLFLNWERDILCKRPEPNKVVLENFDNLVPKQAFDLDMKNLLDRVKQYKDFTKKEDDLLKEARFKIACEAEEGRFILSNKEGSYFSGGNILITPLEFPERLVFFGTISPDFQKRIVPMLKLYPWRMDADTLDYK